MKLYLLRHGQTVSPATYSGISDIGLSEKGEQQILRISQFLRYIDPDVCYCSPLSRCRRTFKLLDIEKKCFLDPDLAEINFGSWEGSTFDEIYAKDKKRVDIWIKEKENFTFPEGDNILEFSKRIKKLFENIIKQEHENVLVISHSGVIRHALCHLLGIEVSMSNHFVIKEGLVSMISSHDDYQVLNYLNSGGYGWDV